MVDANLNAGDSTPPANPVTCLRDWLDRLSSSGRLAVTRPGVDLRFELAAVAKRLDGRQASFFPAPSGHSMPVVSGLVSSRDWIAEALAVRPRELLSHFEAAVAAPRRPRLVDKAPVQAVVHRSVDLYRLLPVPTHNEHDRGPYITAGLLITAQTTALNARVTALNATLDRQTAAVALIQALGGSWIEPPPAKP